jgi:hypothetical protein
MLLRFMGYRPQNASFEALNCHFHGQNSLIQIKIFTAEPHLPAGRQEGRQGVIFYLSREVPGANKKACPSQD